MAELSGKNEFYAIPHHVFSATSLHLGTANVGPRLSSIQHNARICKSCPHRGCPRRPKTTNRFGRRVRHPTVRNTNPFKLGTPCLFRTSAIGAYPYPSP